MWLYSSLFADNLVEIVTVGQDISGNLSDVYEHKCPKDDIDSDSFLSFDILQFFAYFASVYSSWFFIDNICYLNAWLCCYAISAHQKKFQ